MNHFKALFLLHILFFLASLGKVQADNESASGLVFRGKANLALSTAIVGYEHFLQFGQRGSLKFPLFIQDSSEVTSSFQVELWPTQVVSASFLKQRPRMSFSRLPSTYRGVIFKQSVKVGKISLLLSQNRGLARGIAIFEKKVLLIKGEFPANLDTSSQSFSLELILEENTSKQEASSCLAEAQLADLPDSEASDLIIKPRSGQASSEELRIAQVAVQTDYEFYSKHGGSQQAIEEEVIEIFNNVSTIYLNGGVRLEFRVEFIKVQRSPEQVFSSTNANTLLQQFTNYWVEGGSDDRVYDLAHLISGKNLDGSTVGTAWIGRSPCSGFPIGVSSTIMSAERVAITVAHEIGHNLSLGHLDLSICPFGSERRWVMCPGVHSNTQNEIYQSSSLEAQSFIDKDADGSCFAFSSDSTPPSSPENLQLAEDDS